jgi:hypothetical protein
VTLPATDAAARDNQAPWQEVVVPLNRTATYFTYGSVTKARSGVQRYLYQTVRRFLCRRHNVTGGGYRQFPDTRVFGELGVFSFAAPFRSRLRTPACETRPRAG